MAKKDKSSNNETNPTTDHELLLKIAYEYLQVELKRSNDIKTAIHSLLQLFIAVCVGIYFLSSLEYLQEKPTIAAHWLVLFGYYLSLTISWGAIICGITCAFWAIWIRDHELPTHAKNWIEYCQYQKDGPIVDLLTTKLADCQLDWFNNNETRWKYIKKMQISLGITLIAVALLALFKSLL